MSNSPFQTSYGAAIDTLQQVGKVVESLYAKVSNVVQTYSRAHSSFADRQNRIALYLYSRMTAIYLFLYSGVYVDD